jgi:hypothetical protein
VWRAADVRTVFITYVVFIVAGLAYCIALGVVHR